MSRRIIHNHFEIVFIKPSDVITKYGVVVNGPLVDAGEVLVWCVLYQSCKVCVVLFPEQ